MYPESGLSFPLAKLEEIKDRYRIICFDGDSSFLLLKWLDPVCRNLGDDRHVRDELLRWNFHQAILVNVKGNGMPVLEHDYPDGGGILSEILGEPMARERLEFEFFTRLSGYEGMGSEDELTSNKSKELDQGQYSPLLSNRFQDRIHRSAKPRTDGTVNWWESCPNWPSHDLPLLI